MVELGVEGSKRGGRLKGGTSLARTGVSQEEVVAAVEAARRCGGRRFGSVGRSARGPDTSKALAGRQVSGLS